MNDYITIKIAPHPLLKDTPITGRAIRRWLLSLFSDSRFSVTLEGDTWLCSWEHSDAPDIAADGFVQVNWPAN